MTARSLPGALEASWLYRNWVGIESGMPEKLGDETPLYSDARFTGELRSGLAPYMLLNTVPHPHDPGELVPALVLRARWVLDDDTKELIEAFQKGKSDVRGVVGGSVQEEFAALLSLSHGVRVAAARPNRWFYGHEAGDEGSPRHAGDAEPTLPEARSGSRIPGLRRRVALSHTRLASFPHVPQETGTKLARSATSYRQAIWIADSDGNQAWLLLVTAAETAANEWARLSGEPKFTASQLLEELKPEFVAKLRAASQQHSDAVVAAVADELGTVLRAQWKFTTFLRKYGATPATPRPTVAPADWTDAGLTRALSKIYSHRSNALHSGQPFPPPMYEPPFPIPEPGNGLPERPLGSASMHGGLFAEDDMPMNLYAFHHLVLTAIQAWWDQLAPPMTTATPAEPAAL